MSEDYNNDSPVWKIEGEQEWRKGNTQIKLSPKAYKIVVRDLEGYQTPKPQIVYVVANQTVQINANYTYVGDAQTSSSQEQSSSEDPSSGEEGGSNETASGSSEEESSSAEWENPNEDILHFVAEKKDSTISFGRAGYSLDGVMLYSIDNCETWQQYTNAYDIITLKNVGDTIYFKTTNKNFHSHANKHFSMSGKIAAYGSVMSLINDTGTSLEGHQSNTFSHLFNGCNALTRAPKLPATTLTSCCYKSMFEGCSSLEEPPVLPATELTYQCYYGMFKGCSSLKYTPVLPASVMAEGCYQYMFSGCSSITMPPTLASMELEGYCYSRMFENCTSLIEMPELPATTIIGEGCYDTMFSGCTSLTSVKNLPCEDAHKKLYYRMFLGCTGLTEVNLPLTSLSIEGCLEMFKDCTNLNKITVNFEHWLDGDNATKDWLKNVSSEGEFVAPEGLEEIRGTSNIPSGWTLTRKSDD